MLLGWAAALGALLLGAHWIAAAVAAALFGGVWLAGVPRAVALLAAPLALAVAAPLATIASWQAGAWAGVACLAVAPVFMALGGGLPWRGLLVWPVVAGAFALAWLHPWSASLFSSDVAARVQVALAAIVFLVASSLGRARRASGR